MTVAPGDFVKVTYRGRDIPVRDKTGQVLEVNHDDETPLTLNWDARTYVINPGDTAFVPFDAMALAFGDPRSGEAMRSVKNESGNIEFVLDRATEVRRLRTRYDNQLGDETVIDYAPQAEVYDLEDNRIRTVVEDPGGESVIQVAPTIVDRDMLLAQVQRQQRMIEMLAEQQGIDLASISGPGATLEDDADEFANDGTTTDSTQTTIPSDS